MEETSIPVLYDTRLFTRIWSPARFPAGIVCLVHGLSDHGGRFVHVAEALAAKGYAFIAPDLRGNGRSPGRRGHFNSLQEVMTDLKLILKDARNRFPGLPVFLYGQSMGGSLVINFVLRFPEEVDGVISSSPWLRLAKPPSGFTVAAASVLKPFFPSALVPNGIKSADLCHDESVQHAYEIDPLIHWKISVRTFFIIQKYGEWAIQHAGMLKKPVLLMHGDADRITSYKASRDFASASNNHLNFKGWPGLFHELHNEPARDEVLAYVSDWLDRCRFRRL